MKLYRYLVDERHEKVLSKQVLRSGTSIGANVAEGLFGASRADFVNVDVGAVEVQRRDKNGKMALRHYEIDFIVNLGLRRIYIQSAYDMDEPGKVEQEKTSLKLSGDFFQKIIVEKGYRKLMQDGDGVWRVGVIPFLLDEDMLSRME